MSTDQTQLPSIRTLFRMTFEKWFYDGIPRHASVLTFCALFAVAPILLFAFEIMGLVYGPKIAETLVLAQIAEFTESQAVVDLMTTLLENTLPSSASWWITASFIIVLIYGVTSFFVELKLVLNHIWGIPVTKDDGIWEFIVSRSQAIFMGLIGGLLVFSGLMITIWLSMVTEWAAFALNLGSGYETWSYIILLFVLFTIIFGLTYKFVPNVKIAWQDVLVGAAATALLFSISRLLISWYFSYSYLNTMFGATSAIVIMLLWVYYSAQIVLLGAEFTYIYSHTYGAWWRGEAVSPRYATEPIEPILEYTYPEDLSILLEKEMTGENLSDRLSISDTSEENEDDVAHDPRKQGVDSVTESAAEDSEQPTRKKWFSNIYQRIRKPHFDKSVVIIQPPEPVEGGRRLRQVQPAGGSERLQSAIEDVEEDHTETQFVLNEDEYDSGELVQSSSTENLTRNLTRSARFRSRIDAFGYRMKQIIGLPLRIIRPVREVMVAVGVIGVISVAALVGIPWWRKKEGEDEGMAE